MLALLACMPLLAASRVAAGVIDPATSGIVQGAGDVVGAGEDALDDIVQAASEALTLRPTSKVKGKAFDRIAIIWLENTDYDMAIGDPNLSWLAKRGITLSSYHAVTHPSQPNYIASIAGDHFGMENDDFDQIVRNVSTVIDLLEDKGISWGEYQEHMPYTGFQGQEYLNQATGANDYVRKHNPAVSYNRNLQPDRLAVMKNFTQFYADLDSGSLPQWMFITPNMTNDGHDTDVTVAGAWSRRFLEPLLDDARFMQNTLVLLTFDENETYTLQNRVLALLLGDALPDELVGTTDDAFYNHYSTIATVTANWGLHTLGRWDVGANVFGWVAARTGDVVRDWAGDVVPLADRFFNVSYAGPMNSDADVNHRYPGPNLTATDTRSVLPAIVDAWKGNPAPVYYDHGLQVPDGLNPPPGYAPAA